MNNESPLVPQGSMVEQKTQSRSRVKIVVFCVLAVHVVGLMALLLQGCKREQAQPPVDNTMPPVADTNLPAMDTNAPPPMDTNVLATPPPVSVPPPAAVTEHVIIKGDTLSGLATKYHVTLKALEAANPNVNPTKLQLGQKIVIPAPVTAPVVTPTPGTEAASGEYKVQSGDNGTKIAAKYGITVKALADANNMTITQLGHLTVGQKLKIPAKASAPVEPAPSPAPATGTRPPGV